MNDRAANLDTAPGGVDEPEYLYHYTDMNGLLGIVQSSSIWATEIHYLNDSMEYAYAARLLEKTASSRYESLDKDQSHVLEKFVDTAKIIAQSTNAFVACFTEERDDLSQWRAYSHSGPGYCIGFDKTKLAKAVADLQHLLLLTCEYDEDEQSLLMNKLIDETIAKAPSSMLSGKGTGVSVMSFPTLHSFIELATRFKHPKFSAENKYRIATNFIGGHHKLKPKVRPGSNLLVPYIQIPLPCELPERPISEILIGPCPEPSLAQSSVDELIVAYSIQGTRVEVSEIPFRNW